MGWSGGLSPLPFPCLQHHSGLQQRPRSHPDRDGSRREGFEAQHFSGYCLFIRLFLGFLRQGFPMHFRLVFNSLCNTGWPQTHSNPPSLTSVLRL